MAGSGPCSLAAVSVSGRWFLFPSRYLAGAVLACVWLSSSVASLSSVVAAVRLALARSLRLGSPLAGPDHNASKRSQPLRPWRRGQRNQQPRRTTNAHDENQAALGLDVRPTNRKSARRCSEESQFATHLVPRSQPPIEARNRRYAIHHRTLVAARGCCRSCPPAPRRCGHRAASPLIERPSPRPSHCPRAQGRPHQFGRGQPFKPLHQGVFKDEQRIRCLEGDLRTGQG